MNNKKHKGDKDQYWRQQVLLESGAGREVSLGGVSSDTQITVGGSSLLRLGRALAGTREPYVEVSARGVASCHAIGP